MPSLIQNQTSIIMYTDKNKVFIPPNIQKLLENPHVEVESPNGEYKIIEDKYNSSSNYKYRYIKFNGFRKINKFKRIL